MGSVRQVVVSAIAAVVGGYLAMVTLLMGGSRLMGPGIGSTAETSTMQPSWIASIHQHAQAIRSITRRTQQLGGPAPPAERMLITGRFQEDVSWLPLKLGTFPTAVYQFVDNITEHNLRCPPGVSNVMRPTDCPFRALKHGGREPIVYLDYIISNYHRLPKKMLFIHPHEVSWHRDNIVNVFHRLRWDTVEFANLRHWRRSEPCEGGYADCGDNVGLMLLPLDPEGSRNPLLNDGQGARNWAPHQSRCLFDFWGRLFQDEFGEVPPQIMQPSGSAEFIVSRERVQLRNLSFYENAFKVVSEATDAGLGHNCAVAMEGMWHAVFGEPFISQAIYKCELLECSVEEAADPLLIPPPLLDPYILYHFKDNATSPANSNHSTDNVIKVAL